MDENVIFVRTLFLQIIGVHSCQRLNEIFEDNICSYLSLYTRNVLQTHILQDDATGSMEIHSNPVTITLNIFYVTLHITLSNILRQNTKYQIKQYFT